MAGGKAKRLGLEKPLVKLGDKFLIDYILNTLKECKKIRNIYILTSKYTEKTGEYLKKLGYRVILSSGEDFVKDYIEAVKELNLKDFLLIACDLPFLKASTLERAIDLYFKSKKDSLTLVVKCEDLISLGLKVDYTIKGYFSPIGVNILNGERIKETYLEEDIMILEDPIEGINIDTKEDIKLARKILKVYFWKGLRKVEGFKVRGQDSILK